MTLHWTDGRWHLDGRGIHAGDRLELYLPQGEVMNGRKVKWLPVRIESYDRGRGLTAWLDIGGLDFIHTIDPNNDELRWPT